MIKRSLLIVLLCPLAVWAAPQAQLSSNGTTVSNNWKVQKTLDHDKVVRAFEKTLSESMIFPSVKGAAPAEKIIKNSDDGTRNIQERRYYYLKSVYAGVPEMMVSFFINSGECFKSQDDACASSSTITMVKPFQLYQTYKMMGAKNLQASDIVFSTSISQNDEDWSSSQSFRINNLMMMEWVRSMKSNFGLSKDPTVHSTLLGASGFLKDFSQRLQQKLTK